MLIRIDFWGLMKLQKKDLCHGKLNSAPCEKVLKGMKIFHAKELEIVKLEIHNLLIFAIKTIENLF